MAKQDAKGKLKYWYDGKSSTLLKNKNNVAIGSQKYWYNGQPQGYLLESVTIITYLPKQYAVLIGF
jgi:hypothetical protein